MTWQPSLGAWIEGENARFRVWAPEAGRLAVVLEEEAQGRREYPLEKAADGYFSGVVGGIGAGALYRYHIDSRGPFPDPASRTQPQGVHGPSAVVDPQCFRWSDASWRGLELERTVLYELHVGTFTTQGSLQSAAQRLPYLKELGITAVELMPVADFAGRRNWGYDGVALFSPANCYGSPDDLRGFVNEAHALGLAVYLDVVYNHLGPDGAYLNAYSPFYFTERHRTPWGAGINFDGPHCGAVRNFFVENALHWVHEYHIDGLRLDATHAILDDSPTHILVELADAVKRSAAESGREVQVIAEDARNLAHMVKPASENGWGLDGVWADDFHHQIRRRLAGDRDGYFADFSGSVEDIAATIRKGWFYCGQYAEYSRRERGTNPEGIPARRFVFCIQNHDQVGNRAFGDRLHHKVDLASYRAASTLLLCCPETPLLFMGQEWAASTPFQFFTDHHQELGRLVTEGRRGEFKRFASFSQPESRERIPDPQDVETFQRCKLDWQEIERPPHAATLRLYRALLELRLAEPALAVSGKADVGAAGSEAVLLRRRGPAPAGPAGDILVIVWLRGSGSLDGRGQSVADAGDGFRWEAVLTTEDQGFADDPQRMEMNLAESAPRVRFQRPGAVVLRQTAA